jgi:hypothetical protein
MNELTTTSLLALFETNKEERQSFALSVISEIESGNIDPLKVHLQVKCMEDIIKLLNSNTIYKSSVLESAQKYGQKSFDYMNSKIEIKETGVKYDYSQCGDVILDKLNWQAENLAKDIKARETILKAVSEKGMIMTDTETGESFTVYPPSKSSTTSIAVTLK